MPGKGAGISEVPVNSVKPTISVAEEKVALISSSKSTPTELLLTGENGWISSTWLALLAALLTYGAVFYLQPKNDSSNKKNLPWR